MTDALAAGGWHWFALGCAAVMIVTAVLAGWWTWRVIDTTKKTGSAATELLRVHNDALGQRTDRAFETGAGAAERMPQLGDAGMRLVTSVGILRRLLGMVGEQRAMLRAQLLAWVGGPDPRQESQRTADDVPE